MKDVVGCAGPRVERGVYLMKDVFVALIAVAVFFFGMFLGITMETEVTQKLKFEAIERGYALHCPKDGSFAWEGGCE
jgi:hypothetical protein